VNEIRTLSELSCSYLPYEKKVSEAAGGGFPPTIASYQ
jgi:hypothetical protein